MRRSDEIKMGLMGSVEIQVEQLGVREYLPLLLSHYIVLLHKNTKKKRKIYTSDDYREGDTFSLIPIIIPLE
jgi:hypothetical protein